MSHNEFGDESTLILENPQKDKDKENFQRGDRKQDKHTGKSSSDRESTRQGEKALKSILARHERADDESFTKAQIAQGIKDWETRRDWAPAHPDSGLNTNPHSDWRKVWKEIKDTSWKDAIEFYEIDMSIDAYEKVQREMEKQYKSLEKEAKDERKIRNFSITGNPDGDKKRTSLVH